MIKMSEVLSIDGTQTIGVSIKIRKEEFFIAADQENWGGIRRGRFPRYHDDFEMIDHPEKQIIEFKIPNR